MLALLESAVLNLLVASTLKVKQLNTDVVCVIKVENIVLRAGIEPTSLAFQASVLPIYHVGSLT